MVTAAPQLTSYLIEQSQSVRPDPFTHQLVIAALQVRAALYISRATVKTHLRSVYHKLGVASRAQAIERAIDLRLLLRPGRGPAASKQPGQPYASVSTVDCVLGLTGAALAGEPAHPGRDGDAEGQCQPGAERSFGDPFGKGDVEHVGACGAADQHAA